MNDTTHNAVIVANSLISFSSVPSHHRHDILDVLMYADHRATQVWRPHSYQWSSWMNYYRSQLVISGCQLKSQIVKPEWVVGSARELDDIGFGVTGSIKVASLMDLARRSFRKAGLHEYASQFFESGSESGFLNAFQVMPCESVGADDVSILICGLYASANVTLDDRGGDWGVKREMVVRLAGGVYNFNAQAYAQHRQRVQSRLTEIGRINLERVSI